MSDKLSPRHEDEFISHFLRACGTHPSVRVPAALDSGSITIYELLKLFLDQTDRHIGKLTTLMATLMADAMNTRPVVYVIDKSQVPEWIAKPDRNKGNST